jgi:hypothetical protein
MKETCFNEMKQSQVVDKKEEREREREREREMQLYFPRIYLI